MKNLKGRYMSINSELKKDISKKLYSKYKTFLFQKALKFFKDFILKKHSLVTLLNTSTFRKYFKITIDITIENYFDI